MLIIRLVAARAVEAVPYRFVALRVLLIVTYGTPRLPPSGSTAGFALSPTPPPGGSDLQACTRRLARFLGMM